MTSLTMAWEWLRSQALSLPQLAKFALAMAIIVGILPLSRRVRLPAVVGLCCGVVLGPHFLGFFGERPHRPIADFFAELGKLLLMFFAGLEIDLALFRRARNKSTIFGLVTTLIPLTARHGRWTLFRLSARCGGRIRITARLPYTARSSDHRSAGRDSTRADHNHVRRDGAL